MIKKLLAKLFAWLNLSSEGRADFIGGGEALPSPLSPEEEKQLISRLAEHDEKAKDELIEHNLRLVVYIAKKFDNTNIDIEDLIPEEDSAFLLTHYGYIKRMPVTSYKAQKRGGKGKSGMSTKDEDFVTRLFVASTHTPVLFFSSKGLVYKMKVYKLPLGSPTSKGKPFINLLPLSDGENITTIMKLPENEADCENMSIMFATAQGNVRRNSLMDFVNVQSNGKLSISIRNASGEDEKVPRRSREGRGSSA